MRKRFTGILLVFTLIISICYMPYNDTQASDPQNISFEVTYKQTDARKMLDMMNAFRAANGTNEDGRRPLQYDYDLEKVAMQRAAEIAVKFDLEHNRPDGSFYKQVLADYGFDISPRNILYGENILFGTEDSMELEGAFDLFCTEDENRKIMLGYFTAVGIGHIKMEDKTDFWVQVFADEGKNFTYVAPIDGKGIATVTVPSYLIESIDVSYTSGNQTVAVGENVSVPAYTPKVKFVESELEKELTLLPLTFDSDDGFVRASGNTMIGLKAGTGTISTDFFGKNYSYTITVTPGNGNITSTEIPTATPTAVPTQAPTASPTSAPIVVPIQIPTSTPTASPTEIPTVAPTETPAPTETSNPTLTPSPTKVPSSSILKKGDTFTEGNVKYKVSADNKVEVTGLSSKKATSAVIPDIVEYEGNYYAVVKISNSAFEGYKSLKTVKLGQNITAIGMKAFKGCKALTKLEIPANVKNIGKQAFYGCSKITTIKFLGTKIKKMGSKAFTKINSKVKLQVPSSKEKAYKKLFKKAGLKSSIVVESF